MNRVQPRADWPESWQVSYQFDTMELYGNKADLGYAFAYQRRRDVTLKLLTAALPKGSTVLDIAAAQGNFSIPLAELGYQVTWNDLRTDLVDYVKLKDSTRTLQYAPGNAFNLDFAGRFDCVVVTEIIEHVAYPDRFLRSVADLVRPGGYIVLTTPNGGYFRNKLPKYSDFPDPSIFEATQFGPGGDDHIFLLHPDEIEKFAHAADLSVIRLKHFTNPLTHGHLRTRGILPLLPRGLVMLIDKVTSALPRRLSRILLVHTAALLRKEGFPKTT